MIHAIPFAQGWTRNSLRAFLMLALLATFVVVSAGCGKKDDEVQTDPDAMPAPTDDAVDTVDLDEDQSFGGDATDQDAAAGEDLTAEDEAVQMILLQDVFFEFNEYDLSEAARSSLAQNGRLLREHGGVRILIEGHCDERGTVQYNLALGERRANEVKRYLQDLGIPVTRIDVVSYGKEKPFALGHEEAVWSQNRRAHFVLR